MIFNKQITIYVNDDGVELEQIANLVCKQTGEWLASKEYGRFVRTCNCGNPTCANVEVQNA